VTNSYGDVLATIDGALEDCTVSDDAMRWSGGQLERVICDGGKGLMPERWNVWRHDTYSYTITALDESGLTVDLLDAACEPTVLVSYNSRPYRIGDLVPEPQWIDCLPWFEPMSPMSPQAYCSPVQMFEFATSTPDVGRVYEEMTCAFRLADRQGADPLPDIARPSWLFEGYECMVERSENPEWGPSWPGQPGHEPVLSPLAGMASVTARASIACAALPLASADEAVQEWKQGQRYQPKTGTGGNHERPPA
jgi:hypothetical protein